MADCALLLEAKDTLRGTETLNWSASVAIASWEGVTTGGTPSRVTRLEIDGWNSERRIGRAITLNGTIPAGLGGLVQAATTPALEERADGDDPGGAREPGGADRRSSCTATR